MTPPPFRTPQPLTVGLGSLGGVFRARGNENSYCQGSSRPLWFLGFRGLGFLGFRVLGFLGFMGLGFKITCKIQTMDSSTVPQKLMETMYAASLYKEQGCL